MKSEILYEDADILVCYKPAGLATQSGRAMQMDMENEIKNYLAGKEKKTPYLAVIHRLDQPVEGLLVFGKNKNAAAGLGKQLVNNSLNKKYLAVVCGKPEEKTGIFVDYMKKEGNIAKVGPKEPESKEAKLTYTFIHQAQIQSQTVALMEIEIETGRFHQIRAQMAAHDMPLLGDQKYGKTDNNRGFSLALCANVLEFRHPISGKKLEFHCKPKNPVFSQF